MIFDLLNTKVFNQEFINSDTAEINHMQAVANPTIGGNVYVSWDIIAEASLDLLNREEQVEASNQLVKEIMDWCEENGYRLWSY